MTNLEKIKAEIERLDDKYRTIRINGTTQQAKEADLVVFVLRGLNNFIESMEKEPTVDLEKEIERYIKERFDTKGNLSVTFNYYGLLNFSKSIWQICSDVLFNNLHIGDDLPEGHNFYDEVKATIDLNDMWNLLPNTLIKYTARHFYELGLNARKEE